LLQGPSQRTLALTLTTTSAVHAASIGPVTRCEPSHAAGAALGARSTLSGMPTLYVMRDSAGPWPVLWREPEPPQDEPDRTWDLVAELQEEEVVPALEALHRKREAGEL
jgi:hypothetical protein